MNSDKQCDEPNIEPVGSNDSQRNDNGRDRYNNDVVKDMEGVEGDWEPESMRRTHMPPLWMSDYVTRF